MPPQIHMSPELTKTDDKSFVFVVVVFRDYLKLLTPSASQEER